jgi:diacylglycerol kinase
MRGIKKRKTEIYSPVDEQSSREMLPSIGEEVLDTPEEFSLIRRAKSFTYAGRGLYVFFKSTHNAWIHAVVFACAVALGFYLHITVVEWMMLVLVGGFVLAAEAFNTAIEIDIDLTSPEYHPYARDTKDVAAGAVLIAATTAFIVGVFIFGHYFI